MLEHTQKLFYVRTRGGIGKYRAFFVIAQNSHRAYAIVREFLDKNHISFQPQRELHFIQLLAEETLVPNCERILMFDEEGRRM